MWIFCTLYKAFGWFILFYFNFLMSEASPNKEERLNGDVGVLQNELLLN